MLYVLCVRKAGQEDFLACTRHLSAFLLRSKTVGKRTACLSVHAEIAGRWMHANTHVFCTVHACKGLVVDADEGER